MGRFGERDIQWRSYSVKKTLLATGFEGASFFLVENVA